MRLRILPIVPLLALIFAACGGGSSKSSSTTLAPTTTAASTATTASGAVTGSDPAAIERAKKLVLVQADFPAGWTATPSSTSADDKEMNKQLDACIGTSGEDAKSADVNGDDFSQGQATQVSSEAQIVKSEATYKSDIAAVKGAKFQPCLQDFATKALTKAVGTAPASVQVTDLDVSKFGDVTIGKRVTAGLTAQGQTINVVVDFVLMGKDKAEVTGTFTNLGQPFDAALEKTLIDKLGAKLTA